MKKGLLHLYFGDLLLGVTKDYTINLECNRFNELRGWSVECTIFAGSTRLVYEKMELCEKLRIEIKTKGKIIEGEVMLISMSVNGSLGDTKFDIELEGVKGLTRRHD